MSFPANLEKHRLALLEMLEESFRDPTKRSAMKTKGVSMEPLVRERDEVVIQAVPVESIEPGDVIVYRFRDVLIVHRVAAVRAASPDGARMFWEKGDANMYLAPVRPADVLGVVVEVVADGRRLRLREPRFRRLGRVVARWGTVSVRLFGAARGVGLKLARPGSRLFAIGRPVVYTVLQAPARVALAVARRVF